MEISNDCFRVLVGSCNPVKAKAIELAFEQVFGELPKISMANVDSGVSDQPITDAETLQGARNRADSASRMDSKYDFFVGIEGGIEENSTGMLAFAWIVIQNTELSGYARTATFPLPHAIAQMVQDGVELGIANDRLFGVENSKREGGAIGHLTRGTIDRTSLYQHAAAIALIPFVNRELFS